MRDEWKFLRDLLVGTGGIGVLMVTTFATLLTAYENPLVATAATAFGLTLTFYVARHRRAEGERTWEAFGSLLRSVASRAGIVDPPLVLEGAITDDGEETWVCELYGDDTVAVTNRICDSCRLELVERHRPVATDGSGAGVPGRSRSVLVCSHCAFQTPGEKDVPEGADVARSRFEQVVEELRGEGRHGLGGWRRAARSTLGRRPTPAEIWDEFQDTVDIDWVRRRTTGELGSPDHRSSDTYAAFADLQRSRELEDRLVELCPAGVDALVARTVRSDYLAEKRRLKRRRDEVREAFSPVQRRFRTTHAEVLSPITRAREHGKWPPEVADERFEAVVEDLTELQRIQEASPAYLLGAEHETVDRLTRQVRQARAYRDRMESIRAGFDASEAVFDAFDEAFGPYAEFDTYLRSEVRAELTEQLETASDTLRQTATTMWSGWEHPPAAAVERYEGLRARTHQRARALRYHEERLLEHERDRFPDVFQTEHGPLNDAQALAVVRDERHNLVDASAGTGKTLTLTQRFRYLYERGVPLDRIVAFTFGSEAAGEMRDRIADALDVGRSRLNVGTMHDRARQVVGRSIGSPIDRDALEVGQDGFLDDAFAGTEELERLAPDAMARFEQHRDWLEEADIDDQRTDSDAVASELRDVFETARNADRSPSDLRAATDRGDLFEYHATHAVAALLEVYGAVADARDHPLDHDHCIQRAIELVEEFPDRYADRYDHVLVDEFQDFSSRDIEFVQGLLGTDGTLFAVGDDWQCINEFRGARPDYFREFEERFPPAVRTVLPVNYRCPPPVVDTSVRVMQASEEATDKTVRAAAGDGGSIHLHTLRGPYTDRCAAYTADLIAETHGNVVERYRQSDDPDADPESILVLTRVADSKQKGRGVRYHLRERDVPVGDDPLAVTLDTLHGAKGTEADHVFVPYADDDTYGGIPMDDRPSDGEGAALGDDTPDRFEAERRLFYVGMTRAETSLQLVAHAEHVSRYLDAETTGSDVAVAEDVVDEVEGTVVSVERDRGGRPPRVVVDCGAYRSHIASWNPEHLDGIESGERHRFVGLEHNSIDFPESLKITGKTTVE